MHSDTVVDRNVHCWNSGLETTHTDCADKIQSSSMSNRWGILHVIGHYRVKHFSEFAESISYGLWLKPQIYICNNTKASQALF
jgi:hypothetical protein